MTDSDLHNKIISALNAQTNILKADIQIVKSQIHKEGEAIRNHLDLFERRLQSIENDVKYLQKSSVRKNIIISGMFFSSYKDFEFQVVNKLNELLDINLKIDDFSDIYKLGKHKDAPIKAELISNIKKKQIFRNTHKLKGTKIYINHDLIKTDQENNKILRRHLKAAREKGLNAYIKRGKLCVNGSEFSVKSLDAQDDSLVEDGNDDDNSVDDRRANSAPSTPTPLTREAELYEDFGLAKDKEYNRYQPINEEGVPERTKDVKSNNLRGTQREPKKTSSDSGEPRYPVRAKRGG